MVGYNEEIWIGRIGLSFMTDDADAHMGDAPADRKGWRLKHTRVSLKPSETDAYCDSVLFFVAGRFACLSFLS